MIQLNDNTPTSIQTWLLEQNSLKGTVRSKCEVAANPPAEESEQPVVNLVMWHDRRAMCFILKLVWFWLNHVSQLSQWEVALCRSLLRAQDIATLERVRGQPSSVWVFLAQPWPPPSTFSMPMREKIAEIYIHFAEVWLLLSICCHEQNKWKEMFYVHKYRLRTCVIDFVMGHYNKSWCVLPVMPLHFNIQWRM